MISAIIITKNEEKMLPGCLRTLKWVNEVVVVDSLSQDNTIRITKKFGAKVATVPENTDYASSRNVGQKAASGDWLFYIDADERVSPELKQEIQKVTWEVTHLRENKNKGGSSQVENKGEFLSYKIPRKNIILGKWLKHGGFWPDYVRRLFHKDALIKWTGKLHESPTVRGEVGLLQNQLKHYTARSISSALRKSAQWSEIEAKLMFTAQVPQVTWGRILKAFIAKFAQIFVVKLGFLDGARGLILAYIQSFHQASVLVNLWQLQQQK